MYRQLGGGASRSFVRSCCCCGSALLFVIRLGVGAQWLGRLTSPWRSRRGVLPPLLLFPLPLFPTVLPFPLHPQQPLVHAPGGAHIKRRVRVAHDRAVVASCHGSVIGHNHPLTLDSLGAAVAAAPLLLLSMLSITCVVGEIESENVS